MEKTFRYDLTKEEKGLDGFIDFILTKGMFSKPAVSDYQFKIAIKDGETETVSRSDGEYYNSETTSYRELTKAGVVESLGKAGVSSVFRNNELEINSSFGPMRVRRDDNEKVVEVSTHKTVGNSLFDTRDINYDTRVTDKDGMWFGVFSMKSWNMLPAEDKAKHARVIELLSKDGKALSVFESYKEKALKEFG